MAIPTVAVLRTAGTTPGTGGGYSFYKDAKLRRITRYRYNNVPGDNGARNYYITRMNEDGTPAETWSPTFLPAKTPLDVYRCRHGIGYTVFEAERVGVAAVDAAFAELNAYWRDLLSTYSVDSGDEKLDRMVNIWNQYQCMVTFNMSRSASYYESGTGRGMGFRDSNQDLLGFVHLIPERARERIIDIASTQLPDGSA